MLFAVTWPEVDCSDRRLNVIIAELTMGKRANLCCTRANVAQCWRLLAKELGQSSVKKGLALTEVSLFTAPIIARTEQLKQGKHQGINRSCLRTRLTKSSLPESIFQVSCC